MYEEYCTGDDIPMSLPLLSIKGGAAAGLLSARSDIHQLLLVFRYEDRNTIEREIAVCPPAGRCWTLIAVRRLDSHEEKLNSNSKGYIANAYWMTPHDEKDNTTIINTTVTQRNPTCTTFQLMWVYQNNMYVVRKEKKKCKVPYILILLLQFLKLLPGYELMFQISFSTNQHLRY